MRVDVRVDVRGAVPDEESRGPSCKTTHLQTIPAVYTCCSDPNPECNLGSTHIRKVGDVTELQSRLACLHEP